MVKLSSPFHSLVNYKTGNRPYLSRGSEEPRVAGFALDKWMCRLRLSITSKKKLMVNVIFSLESFCKFFLPLYNCEVSLSFNNLRGIIPHFLPTHFYDEPILPSLLRAFYNQQILAFGYSFKIIISMHYDDLFLQLDRLETCWRFNSSIRLSF